VELKEPESGPIKALQNVEEERDRMIGEAHNCAVGAQSKTRNDVVITIKEFLFSLDIDNINLVKLQRYISNMAARVTHLPEIQPLILRVTNISP